MEAVAETVAPHFAFGAVVGFHPVAVAVFFKTVLPNVPETVFVNVSLMVISTNA